MENPGGEGGVRSYHFISDPEFKENLSGRVRAACINCRRKKIRCSGEASCRTCQERGSVCEGLSQRKRPNKGNRECNRKSRGLAGLTQLDIPEAPSSDSERYASLDSTIGGSARSASPLHRDSRRKNLRALPGHSAYSTGKQTPPGESGKAQTAQLRTYTSIPIQGYGAIQGYGEPAYPPTTQLFSPIALNGATDLSEARHRIEWWSSETDNEVQATKLLCVAQMLEEQVQSLRQLASEQTVESGSDAGRCTAALPLRYDGKSADDRSQYYSQTTFVDLSLISDCPTGTGLTPYVSSGHGYFDDPFDLQQQR